MADYPAWLPEITWDYKSDYLIYVIRRKKNQQITRTQKQRKVMQNGLRIDKFEVIEWFVWNVKPWFGHFKPGIFELNSYLKTGN